MTNAQDARNGQDTQNTQIAQDAQNIQSGQDAQIAQDAPPVNAQPGAPQAKAHAPAPAPVQSPVQTPRQGQAPVQSPGPGPAGRGRAQARVMNALNVPMRRVLGLPVRTPLGKRLMLAYIVGRKSGRLYRQPLSYVRDGDVLLTPGGGRWKLNLDPAKPVRLRIRGRDHQALPELVRDQNEVSRLLGVIASINPGSARFIPLPKGPDGKPEPRALAEAIKHGFCIVRWHLGEDAATSEN